LVEYFHPSFFNQTRAYVAYLPSIICFLALNIVSYLKLLVPNTFLTKKMKQFMQKLASVFLVLLISMAAVAQSSQKMSYQAVIRDANNQLVDNKQVGLRLSIVQGSASGTVVYTETQTPTTNANGLMSIQFGGGTGYSSISWGSNAYFIKTEVDPTGGTNYSIVGTSQFLSVPYALYALNAGSSASTTAALTTLQAGITTETTRATAAEQSITTAIANLVAGFTALKAKL
jgi:hypothetical protein